MKFLADGPLASILLMTLALLTGVWECVNRASSSRWFRPAIAGVAALVAMVMAPEEGLLLPLAVGAVLTEGMHMAEFLVSEANGTRSREAITVLSGQNLLAGHVLARRLVSPTVAAAAALNTNTGNGAVSGQAVGTNLGAQRGTYRIVFIEPGTNLGTFQVFDPAGAYVGDGVVATEFDNQIKFTIADGATDFVAGDAFTIAVTGGTYKYKEYDPTDADGGQRAVGVLYGKTDATSADAAAVAIVRDAEVRTADLQWFSGATSAQKETALAQLAALGVIGR